MKKVVLRSSNAWGQTSTVILAGGYAMVMVTVTCKEPDVAIIHDLVVHEGRRKKGLGDMLLKEAALEAEAFGTTKMRLAAEPLSWQSEWYAKRGFKASFMASYDNKLVSIMEKENSPRGDRTAGPCV